MRTLKRLRFCVLLSCAILITLSAFLGPALAPEDPNRIDLNRIYQPPDRNNLFGTDAVGRDLFSRVIHGARNSFALTLTMVLIVACIGSIIGMASGYIGGAADSVIMQITDVLLSFPTVVFAITIAVIWGAGIYRTLTALALVSWAKYARMARGLILDIRSSEYITQARFAGARRRHILFKYLLPNILPQIIVITTSDIGEMMVTLSALSFLGVTGSPYEPEWGRMLADSRSNFLIHPYSMIYPGLALLIVVIVFYLLGDSLRDVLDPKEK